LGGLAVFIRSSSVWAVGVSSMGLSSTGTWREGQMLAARVIEARIEFTCVEIRLACQRSTDAELDAIKADIDHHTALFRQWVVLRATADRSASSTACWPGCGRTRIKLIYASKA